MVSLGVTGVSIYLLMNFVSNYVKLNLNDLQLLIDKTKNIFKNGLTFLSIFLSDILPILMSFTLIYMLMILAIVMVSVELKARQFLHATYKLFIVSVSLQELGIMSQSISYIRYAVDGVGFTRLRNFGKDS